MSWFDAGRRRPSSQTSFSSAHPSGGIPLRSRSEEHTSELQSQSNLVCRLLLEKKKNEQELEIAVILSETYRQHTTDRHSAQHEIHDYQNTYSTVLVASHLITTNHPTQHLFLET